LALRPDRHATADPLLAARRPEPAPIGLEADQEGAVEMHCAGHGVAVKAERVLLVAAGRHLVLVAQPELDELDAIGEAVSELAGQVSEAMAVSPPHHSPVHLPEARDFPPQPAPD